MRVHAISDLHVDYDTNRAWLNGLSGSDYQEDVLVVAGDISEEFDLLRETLDSLVKRFLRVCFVPGNHDLWVREPAFDCSLAKFEAIIDWCRKNGVEVDAFSCNAIRFIPLQGWYDYSFREPDRYLRRAWRDYRACAWPGHLGSSGDINRHFLAMNLPLPDQTGERVISFSHFVPRLDLMPSRIPVERQRVYPVLGSVGLGMQVEELRPAVHVYGHSHVNRHCRIGAIDYVNNAFGYPSEQRIARKRLHCIHPLSPGETVDE